MGTVINHQKNTFQKGSVVPVLKRGTIPSFFGLCYLSLHCLVQVASFVGAERVESGHHKLPIEGSSSQQLLGLFGVTRVGVFYEDLVHTRMASANGSFQIHYSLF